MELSNKELKKAQRELARLLLEFKSLQEEYKSVAELIVNTAYQEYDRDDDQAADEMPRDTGIYVKLNGGVYRIEIPRQEHWEDLEGNQIEWLARCVKFERVDV